MPTATTLTPGTKLRLIARPETIVTFVETLHVDGIERARFRAAHGGYVQLSLATFLERYECFTEEEPPAPIKSELDIAFEQHGLILKNGQILDRDGYPANCPRELTIEYLAKYPLNIEWASGPDIHMVFEKYRPGSCMAHGCRHSLRELYAKNPDVVSVAFVRDEHYLMCGPASCLVWHFENTLVVDRVYSQGFRMYDGVDRFQETIAAAAKLKYPELMLHQRHDRMAVEMKWDVEDPLPYCDSFKWASDNEDGTIKMATYEHNHSACCQSTDGTLVGGNYCECCNCHDRIDDDDHHVDEDGEDWCESCFDENFSYDEIAESYAPCDDVERYSVYNRHGNVEYVYATEDSIGCRHTKCDGESCDYVHDSRRIETHDGDWISPADLESGDYVETVDNEIMLADDAYLWESDGEWHSEEEPEETDDDDESDTISINGVTAKVTDLKITPQLDFEVLASVGYGKQLVKAHRVSDVLCIRPQINQTSDWVVTHIPTGLAIYQGQPSYEDALAKATRFMGYLEVGSIADGMLAYVRPARDYVEVLAAYTPTSPRDADLVQLFQNSNYKS